MSDLIGIASNAISAYQRALSTVSNNIANVNTEGYSKQEVLLKEATPTKVASNFMGTGVLLQRIKRQYDDFAESNLRKSTSDLSSQKPMVDYAKRVMDIMADKSAGLSSALDNFFGAAGALSADPASTVLRTSFLRSSEGVASRLAEISGQLDLIKKETQEGLISVVAQVNTLTSQLALINRGLANSPNLEGQPSELLDRRDLTLRQLSDLVKIKTTFTSNGVVNVSVGTTMTETLVVNTTKAKPIGVRTTLGKVEMVLDPYGTTEALPALTGGQIGGYQNFIAQVLDPTTTNLDDLTKTFVNEANLVQKNGIDGYGQMGTDLFGIDPKSQQVAAGVHVLTGDGLRVATAAQFRVSEGNTNVTTTRATVRFTGVQPTDPLNNKQLVNNPSQSAGVTFKVDGLNEFTPVSSLTAGVKATFFIDGAKPGQNLQVMTRDGRQLLGKPLTETEKYQLLKPDYGFAPNATYSDQYLNKSGSLAYRDLDMFYGAKEIVKYRQNFDAQGKPAKPTVMAAELNTGRIADHLEHVPAGAIVLNGVEMPEFFPPDTSDANYVADWINGQTVASLANLSMGIPVGLETMKSRFSAAINGIDYTFDQLGSDDFVSLASEIQDQFVQRENNDNISVEFKDGAILVKDKLGREIKDVSLTPLNANPGAISRNVTVTNSNYVQTGVIAKAYSEIRVPVSQLDLKKNLSINGIPIDQANFDYKGYSSPEALLLTINQSGAGVSAIISQGDLIISDPNNRSITIDQDIDGNALDIKPATYNPQIQLNKVVRDFTVGAANFDPSKPLVINGVTILLANEDPVFQGRANLQTGTISGVSFGTITPAAAPTTFKKFEIIIDGKKITVNPKPAAAPTAGNPWTQADAMNAMAADLQEQLQSLDKMDPADITVTVANDSTLQFTSASSRGIQSLALTSKSSLEKLVQRINDNQPYTGVVSKLDVNGDINISVTDLLGKQNIAIGPAKDPYGNYQNALDLEPINYDETKRLEIKMATDPAFQTDIRFSFGSYSEGLPNERKYGDPSQFAQMGLRTGAYLQDGCLDDLLVFVTSKGAAKVSVGFDGQPDIVRDSLRNQTLQINFTAPDRYTIVDTKTGTELANRSYDPRVIEPVIDFEGLSIKLTHAPAVGDSYRIDGNHDGLGNNVNMLDMVDLAKKQVKGGKTIHDTYIDQVNSVGNLAQQATITQQALQVVKDQAVSSRDKVSGVNLDDEAADLIRYQQAYQAAAKALQVGSQLLDTIIAIR